MEDLNEQAIRILDYQRGGLLFKWLKCLMMVHGVFFISCFIMPMTGVFTDMTSGENGNGGTIALLGWCAYFIPIGVLAYRHFQRG